MWFETRFRRRFKLLQPSKYPLPNQIHGLNELPDQVVPYFL
jgi:hypothetical protein